MEEFQYLDSIISKTSGTCEDIKARISKARHTFALLRPVSRITSLSLKTKLRIFSSIAKSVLLYRSETWQLTATLINKIQVCVNKCLRRILGIRWPERIRNEDLWQQTGQEPIETERKKRSWRWIGHTVRKEDGKHRQSCTGVESTGETEERAPHTGLEENAHDRAEGEKHQVDEMQENGKEQDEVESTSGRPMFHLGTKWTKRERDRRSSDKPHDKPNETCYYCGKPGHGHKALPKLRKQKCLAFGTVCQLCGRSNHYETTRQSKDKALQQRPFPQVSTDRQAEGTIFDTS